jgi:dihydrodipicolinate synthase/N-acetylneuraminate lyase
VTPLREAGERIDEDVIAPLLDFYAAGGLDGLLMLGTAGEGILLAAGALRIVVHCGAQTTAETRALAAHAAEAGAARVAVIAPPYFAFDADELLEHFAAAVANARAAAALRYEYVNTGPPAWPTCAEHAVVECVPASSVPV